jgi:hypothetical protein
LESFGNTDGVLTWRLGTLARDRPVREVVLFAFDRSADGVARRLDGARRQFETSAPLPSAPAGERAMPEVWIGNATTDFALQGPAFFRWDWTKRQGLRGPRGGQLSQFTWYIHYRDRDGERRAGTPHSDKSTPEGLRIVEPVRKLTDTQAAAVLETADGKLRVRVRAIMGDGSVAAVEFLVTNLQAEPLTDVRLTAYANLEAAHDESNDYSCLDRRTVGLLVYDPPTGTCAVMTGLGRPATPTAATSTSSATTASRTMSPRCSTTAG